MSDGGGTIRCSHCERMGKALVVETRRDETGVYRRRSCGFCGKCFVTHETAPKGLRMPSQFARTKREKSEAKKYQAGDIFNERKDGGPRVTSTELFRNW